MTPAKRLAFNDISQKFVSIPQYISRKTMHHTLFISDLHLEPKRPDITNTFLHFLTQQAQQADALYILGDFFEVWIGDDEKSAFHQTIINALKQLTANGLPVYFMRGNRDFLIGEAFIQATGCRFLPDPTLIDLYGEKILLTHGDALCTSDYKHQRFRKYAQNPKYNRFFLCLPLFIRRTIAKWIRGASQKHTAKTSYTVMDVSQTAVEKQMCEKNVALLIHGHTHRPTIHEFLLDKKLARRVVLHDWHNRGGVLIYKESGEISLVEWPLFGSPLLPPS